VCLTPSLPRIHWRSVEFLCFVCAIMLMIEVKSEQRVGDEVVLVLPVLLNQETPFECESLVSSDGHMLWMQWQSLGELLEDQVDGETYTVLSDRVDSEGFIEASSLNEGGLFVQFDMASLEVTMTIPPKLRKLREISLRGQRRVNGTVPVVEPADLSGYLNIDMMASQAYGSSVSDGGGFEMPGLGWEQVIHFRNWVLESDGSVDPGTQGLLNRRGTRLIRDNPGRRIRYSFGDIRPSVVTFQDPMMLMGLSVNRENRLQPFRHARPQAQTELFLERDSEVEIFVNGESMRRLQLTSGSYRIQDLQLSGGSTDVEVVVTDESGVARRIDLSFAFDQALLAVGESDFSYSVGFRPESGQVKEGYDIKEPVLSAFRRSGRSDVFTSGWNLQASREVGQWGTEGIWATKWGTFRGELSQSYALNSRFGYAIGTSFVRYSSSKRGQREGGHERSVYRSCVVLQTISESIVDSTLEECSHRKRGKDDLRNHSTIGMGIGCWRPSTI
jgi:outer membrane usher protein FimD/PapC